MNFETVRPDQIIFGGSFKASLKFRNFYRQMCNTSNLFFHKPPSFLLSTLSSKVIVKDKCKLL